MPSIDVVKMPIMVETYQKALKQRGVKIKFVMMAMLKINGKLVFSRNIRKLSALEVVQRGLLNAVAPIANLQDCCTRAISTNETTEAAGVLDALNHTLALIGDANALATYERRKTVLAAIQPELAEYATNEPGEPNATNLFGQELRSKIKETIELNKDLETENVARKCLAPTPKKQKIKFWSI